MRLDLFGIGGNPADFGPVGDNFFSSFYRMVFIKAALKLGRCPIGMLEYKL